MFSNRPRPERNWRAVAEGFTLIEVLIALVIGALVVSGLLRVIEGSTRFAGMLSAREEVQQNARAALELIAGELRAVPPSAIVTMGAETVRFRHPRTWGVLCETLFPESTVAWAVFPADVVPDEAIWGRPHWGLGVQQTVDPGAPSAAYRFMVNLTREVGGGACDALVAPGSTERQGLGFGGIDGGSLVAGDSVSRGALVMLFEEMQYDVRESGTVRGRWIRRMTGYTAGSPNMQPMAGPVPERSGLRLDYLRGDGIPAERPEEIREIELRVEVRSRASSVREGESVPEARDSVSMRIHLRNGGG